MDILFQVRQLQNPSTSAAGRCAIVFGTTSNGGFPWWMWMCMAMYRALSPVQRGVLTQLRAVRDQLLTSQTTSPNGRRLNWCSEFDQCAYRHYKHRLSIGSIWAFITGPPNGPVLFSCWRLSTSVVCHRRRL